MIWNQSSSYVAYCKWDLNFAFFVFAVTKGVKNEIDIISLIYIVIMTYNG